MLEFTVSGPQAGPRIVFLHGVGISAWMWQAVVAHLPEHQVVLIDMPGHGKSRDIAWVSLKETAAAVNATVASLPDARETHLVGLSLGAYVGLLAMAERPHVYGSAFLSGMHASGMKMRWLYKAMTWLMAPLVPMPFVARRTARGFGAEVAPFVAEAGKTKARAFRRAFNQVVDFALPRGLGDIQTRTVFAAGAKEHPLILKSLDELAAALPNARAMTVPGLGHGWPIEDPARFAAMLHGQFDEQGVGHNPT
ncbi:MAG: alpha/beta hydrolase [Pseudomonadota bacterium]